MVKWCGRCSLEQLFPLPIEQLKAIIAQYPNVDDYVWAQEEPKNMGAYITHVS